MWCHIDWSCCWLLALAPTTTTTLFTKTISQFLLLSQVWAFNVGETSYIYPYAPVNVKQVWLRGWGGGRQGQYFLILISYRCRGYVWNNKKYWQKCKMIPSADWLHKVCCIATVIFVWPLMFFNLVKELATKLGLKVHMDGARLFNAATFLGVPVAQVTQHVDSVSFCLSKVKVIKCWQRLKLCESERE